MPRKFTTLIAGAIALAGFSNTACTETEPSIEDALGRHFRIVMSGKTPDPHSGDLEKYYAFTPVKISGRGDINAVCTASILFNGLGIKSASFGEMKRGQLEFDVTIVAAKDVEGNRELINRLMEITPKEMLSMAADTYLARYEAVGEVIQFKKTPGRPEYLDDILSGKGSSSPDVRAIM